MERVLLIIIFIGLLIIGGMIGKKIKKTEGLEDTEGKIVYFYSQTCPHCAKVEEFLEENNVEGKISFEKKEIYSDEKNMKLLILLAKKCNLKENEIGVPFLWDGSKCIIGDIPIIEYFKGKIATQR